MRQASPPFFIAVLFVFLLTTFVLADEKHQTVTFKTTIEFSGRPKMSTTTLLMGPRRARKILANGEISVIDLTLGKAISLNPKSKTGFVYKLDAKPELNLLDEIRQVDETKAERLPEKHIGEQRVTGFRVREKHGAVTTEKVLWVDAKSNRPVQIDRVDSGKGGKVFLRETSKEFVFGKALDERLFETTMPDGYTAKKTPESRVVFSRLK